MFISPLQGDERKLSTKSGGYTPGYFIRRFQRQEVNLVISFAAFDGNVMFERLRHSVRAGRPRSRSGGDEFAFGPFNQGVLGAADRFGQFR